jgi:hypothetical protein
MEEFTNLIGCQRLEVVQHPQNAFNRRMVIDLKKESQLNEKNELKTSKNELPVLFQTHSVWDSTLPDARVLRFLHITCWLRLFVAGFASIDRVEPYSQLSSVQKQQVEFDTTT